MYYPRHAEAIQRRQALLSARTKAEICFASHLKALKIRHQEQSIFHLDQSHYRIVDFYLINPYRIVVELDGSAHDNPNTKSYDEWKDRKLVTIHRRFRVIRFTNDEVMAPGFIDKLQSSIGKYKLDISTVRRVRGFSRHRRWHSKFTRRVDVPRKTQGRFLNLGLSVVKTCNERSKRYPGFDLKRGFSLAEMRQMGAL